MKIYKTIKKYGFFLLSVYIAGFSASCKKDLQTLDPAEAYIKEAASADTLSYRVSPDIDSAIVMKFSVALKNTQAKDAHHIFFMTDTNRIAAYRSKYGNALLLPKNSYNAAWLDCSIAPGQNQSDQVQINIVHQKQLKPSTTYVLPVVMKSIDGKAVGAAEGNIIYLVVKTAQSKFIPRGNWKISRFSSQYVAANSPGTLLDANLTTSWWSDIFASMPQFVEIDMGEVNQLRAITYDCPNYIAQKGYPKQVMIELSMDGTTWINKGTYPGATGINTQKVDIGSGTARYFRFTVVSVEPFFGFYQAVNIAEIGAIR